MDGDVSVIEFELTINAERLKGVDIVHWDNEKILRLDAYLY